MKCNSIRRYLAIRFALGAVIFATLLALADFPQVTIQVAHTSPVGYFNR